jgi:hypothetical protein
MKSLALVIFTMIPAFTFSVLAQTPPPLPASNTQREVVDPSQQPLPDQSLTRPTQGVDNSTLPLSDQTLLNAPSDAPVSGGVQISPRISSGPDNTVRSKSQKADDALTQKIRKNLLNHDANFAKTVVVTSKNGVVTLTGQVDTLAQRNATDKITRRSAGKSQVKNELTTTR